MFVYHLVLAYVLVGYLWVFIVECYTYILARYAKHDLSCTVGAMAIHLRRQIKGQSIASVGWGLTCVAIVVPCVSSDTLWLASSAPVSNNVDDHDARPQQDGVGSLCLQSPTWRSTEWGTVGGATRWMATALRPR